MKYRPKQLPILPDCPVQVGCTAEAFCLGMETIWQGDSHWYDTHSNALDVAYSIGLRRVGNGSYDEDARTYPPRFVAADGSALVIGADGGSCYALGNDGPKRTRVLAPGRRVILALSEGFPIQWGCSAEQFVCGMAKVWGAGHVLNARHVAQTLGLVSGKAVTTKGPDGRYEVRYLCEDGSPVIMDYLGTQCRLPHGMRAAQ